MTCSAICSTAMATSRPPLFPGTDGRESTGTHTRYDFYRQRRIPACARVFPAGRLGKASARVRDPAGCAVARAVASLLRAPGTLSLRKFFGGQLVSPGAPAATLLQRLCILSHLR